MTTTMRLPTVLLAVALLGATPAPAATTAPAPAPAAAAPACIQPDAPAALLKAEPPNLAPLGGERHVAGVVRVEVSLDARSQVADVRIERSPSNILNGPALDAARKSTYQTAVHDCAAVPSTYHLSVVFDSL